ncbi:MAG: PRC-barrel domain-containing protein [Coriobacteriia bacterium]|nr:PRC-barrel domain-containing protein [Coriobacteriia bacterium]
MTTRGKSRGSVEYTLFHPREPRVVGFQIVRPRFLYLIDRRPLFVPLSEVRLGTERLDARNDRLATGGKAARRLGFGWESTIIWEGMPVRTLSGNSAGAVWDVQFDDAEGNVTAVVLSEGMTADMAVGRRTIEGRHVRGFRDDAIIIEDVVDGTQLSGGTAAVAGRSAAVAKKAATDTAIKAVAAGKATAKMAGETEIGRKALGAWKGLVRGVKDAMKEHEES